MQLQGKTMNHYMNNNNNIYMHTYESKAVLFNLFAIVEPLIYFLVCHGTPINKNWKSTNSCKKIEYFIIGHFNK